MAPKPPFGKRICISQQSVFFFLVDPVHYLRDLQTTFFPKKTILKLCPTALFTYLKIILLQYFQFSAISGIQTDPKQIRRNVAHLLVRPRVQFIENITLGLLLVLEIQSRYLVFSFDVTILKLGLTVLFTHLKIILLQYFQISVISGIQIDPKQIRRNMAHLLVRLRVQFIENITLGLLLVLEIRSRYPVFSFCVLC